MIKTINGAIMIIARMGSTRLDRKHLIDVNGEPIISYLIRRMKYFFKKEIEDEQLTISIVTGSKEKNSLLGEVAKNFDISIFYGNDINIPLRINQFVTKYNYDFVISIDGENTFCAPEGIKKVYNQMMASRKYVKTDGYPFGMNSMGFSKRFIMESTSCLKKSMLETGWDWVFDINECHKIVNKNKTDERLRFTLDYIEDLEFYKSIILSDLDIISASTDEIINLVLKRKFFLKNMDLNKTYWERFNKLKQKEIRRN